MTDCLHKIWTLRSDSVYVCACGVIGYKRPGFGFKNSKHIKLDPVRPYRCTGRLGPTGATTACPNFAVEKTRMQDKLCRECFQRDTAKRGARNP